MILSWLAVSVAHAACPEPVAATALNTAVIQAFSTYATAPTQFPGTADQAMGMVDCLKDSAPPSLAASLHWIRGMKLLSGGDALASQRAITAALRIDPGSNHPASGELGQVIERAQAGIHPVSTVPLLLPGYIVNVDGKRTTERPVDGPYLLQVVDAGGGVAFTQYVGDGEEPKIPHDVRALATVNGSLGVPAVLADANPDWSRTAGPEDLPDDFAAPPRFSPPSGGSSGGHSSGGSHKGSAFLISGLVSGGLAAGSFGTAVFERSQYDKVKTSSGYFVTNGAYFGSIGGAVVSSALLTTFLIVR